MMRGDAGDLCPETGFSSKDMLARYKLFDKTDKVSVKISSLQS